MMDYNKMNEIIKRVDGHRKMPDFEDEYNRRVNRSVRGIDTHSLIKTMAELICYSQNARAQQVTDMIDKGYLDMAFNNFNQSGNQVGIK